MLTEKKKKNETKKAVMQSGYPWNQSDTARCLLLMQSGCTK